MNPLREGFYEGGEALNRGESKQLGVVCSPSHHTCWKQNREGKAKLPSLELCFRPWQQLCKIIRVNWKAVYLSFLQQVWLLQISLTSLH